MRGLLYTPVLPNHILKLTLMVLKHIQGVVNIKFGVLKGYSKGHPKWPPK